MQRINISKFDNNNRNHDTYYLATKCLVNLPLIRVDKDTILIKKRYLEYGVLGVLDRLGIKVYESMFAKSNTPDDPRVLVIEGINSSRTYVKVKLSDLDVGNAYLAKDYKIVYMPHTYSPGKHKTKI